MSPTHRVVLFQTGCHAAFDGVWSPPVGGFIVPETLRERGGLLQTSDARLDSYGRLQLGALVPVTESDFGCCGPLFGGELTCTRQSSTPPESLCRDRQPSRA